MNVLRLHRRIFLSIACFAPKEGEKVCASRNLGNDPIEGFKLLGGFHPEGNSKKLVKLALINRLKSTTLAAISEVKKRTSMRDAVVHRKRGTANPAPLGRLQHLIDKNHKPLNEGSYAATLRIDHNLQFWGYVGGGWMVSVDGLRIENGESCDCEATHPLER